MCYRLVIRRTRPVLGSRKKSTNFRYVESKPPIEIKSFDCSAPAFFPTATIDIVNSKQPVVTKDSKVLNIVHEFPEMKPGSFLICNDQLRNIFKDESIFDDMYKKTAFANDQTFLHLSSSIMKTSNKASPVNLITGDRRCGKTMCAFYALLEAMHQSDNVIIPALHLSKWFQDTLDTQMISHKKDMTDFPVINKEFLEFFLKCNLYNPSNPLKNIRILEDERWASRVYSFKGDSIVDVAKLGIENPPILYSVISVILQTLLLEQVPTTTIIDNMNLLSEIHSSKLETHRDLNAADWWNQPHLIPDNITLLRMLKDNVRATQEVVGSTLFGTIDERNRVEDKLIQELDAEDYSVIGIDKTLNNNEYIQYLCFLRKCGILSRDLDKGELLELTYITGRNYLDTYRLLFLI